MDYDQSSYGLVVGAVVLIAVVTAINVVEVVRYIQRQRLRRPVQNAEFALHISFDILFDRTITAVFDLDRIGFDYMEYVLNVINFRSASNCPSIIIEPQLPSRNGNTTSLEADSGSSQSVLPSETEMDLEQIDDTNKYMDQDYTQNLSDDSCVGSSTSPLGSYSFHPSPDCGGEDCPTVMVASFTYIHGFSTSQYAQIYINPSTSNSYSTPHPPITRLPPSYATIGSKKEACAAYETNDRHNKSCMVYTGMSGYNPLSPLMVNREVVGPTPVEDRSERFEYENGRIDSYEGNEEICVPDFKTVASCHESNPPLPDQYGCLTQSGSPVVSAMPSSSKYSVLICMATTNRKKELSDSLSPSEHQKNHSKANVSDLLCGSFSADEKMPSSTEVIHEGGLSSNEVVLEKTGL